MRMAKPHPRYTIVIGLVIVAALLLSSLLACTGPSGPPGATGPLDLRALLDLQVPPALKDVLVARLARVAQPFLPP